MAKITYSFSNFNRDFAKQGELVVAVKSNATSPITNIVYNNNDDSWTKNNNFLGAGICKVKNDSYILTVNSKDYIFDNEGTGVGATSGYILKMAHIATADNTAIVSAGFDATAATRATTVRDDRGIETTIVDGTENMYIDAMTARDQFANMALKGIISHIEDPTTLSPSVMSNYCEIAYQWAAQMMQAAANARSVIVDNRTTVQESRAAVDTESLETNTEKLLNNLVIAVQKNDAYWSKTGKPDQPGIYTDEAAQALPTTGAAYSGIAAAEADGWVWHQGFPKREYNPELIDWLSDFNKHTPVAPETNTTVGVDDIIAAIKTAKSIGNTGLGRDSSNPICTSNNELSTYLAGTTPGTTVGLKDLIQAIVDLDTHVTAQLTAIATALQNNP